GSYLTGDASGGSVSTGKRVVVRDRKLQAFMLEAGKASAIACPRPACSADAARGVDLASLPPAGRPIQYSRNSVSYDVELAADSLLVENEMFAPGWSGECGVHGEKLAAVRVQGAVRGWVLGGGHHALTFRYSTPLLGAGAAL